jgi:hypothetical protein
LRTYYHPARAGEEETWEICSFHLRAQSKALPP